MLAPGLLARDLRTSATVVIIRAPAKELQCRSLVQTNAPFPPCSSLRRRKRPRHLEPLVQAVAQQEQKGLSHAGSSSTGKQRVVLLGSGWGSISFIKSLPKNIAQKYEITMVSPRNYFLFTALLPAAAFGNVETRSIIESNRKLIQGKGTYLEAACTAINTEAQTINARFPRHAGLPEHCFQLPYDILIVATGSVNNTFGIQGVKEHAFFFKSIEDAMALRQRVCECFERAALPDTTPEQVRALLTFIIVGGGPTGVEVAAELHDLLEEDLKKYYGSLVTESARVLLVELGDHVLSSYDRAISEYTSGLFQRGGIDLVLNSRVTAIEENRLTIKDAQGQEQNIAFGACVWATGVAIHPLAKHLQQQLPAQSHFRSIVTDSYLRVLGSDSTIWALGDAATVDQPRALERAEELFDQADPNSKGKLSLAELQTIMQAASKEYSHLEEHARFLAGKVGLKRWGGMVAGKLQSNSSSNGAVPQGVSYGGLESLDETCQVTREQFKDILKSIDKGLRALPATGQVAGQQGKYLAKTFSDTAVKSGIDLNRDSKVQPFRYKHAGSTAYVGSDRAVFDLPKLGTVTGLGAGFLWRGFETYRQISFRNQCLVVSDFIKTKIFGRDVEFGQAEEEPSSLVKY
ncbi:hypothetical protein WJX73_007780 [Symbiochloris irregularis]|uniref:NADH:ubiquinone reductase (non-electrogenic) n=1 Tax=Symbiochloris irregularis TaxID=706552 RepID=A0AAW1PVE1_9CHLO